MLSSQRLWPKSWSCCVGFIFVPFLQEWNAFRISLSAVCVRRLHLLVNHGRKSSRPGAFDQHSVSSERPFWRARLYSRASLCRSFHFFCCGRGIVPTTIAGHDLVRFCWAPSVWFILVDRRRIPQRRIDNAPGSFDAVLANEQHRVASNGIAEEAFVRRHLVV